MTASTPIPANSSHPARGLIRTVVQGVVGLAVSSGLASQVTDVLGIEPDWSLWTEVTVGGVFAGYWWLGNQLQNNDKIMSNPVGRLVMLVWMGPAGPYTSTKG